MCQVKQQICAIFNKSRKVLCVKLIKVVNIICFAVNIVRKSIMENGEDEAPIWLVYKFASIFLKPLPLKILKPLYKKFFSEPVTKTPAVALKYFMP